MTGHKGKRDFSVLAKFLHTHTHNYIHMYGYIYYGLKDFFFTEVDVPNLQATGTGRFVKKN